MSEENKNNNPGSLPAQTGDGFDGLTASGSTPPALSEVEVLTTSEFEKLKKERDEYLSGWQRAKADFINYKKDEMKRFEEIARYGSEELIREVVTIIDNFDLALRAMEKNGSVEKGVYLIRSQIEDILRKRGVERIVIKAGDRFDPAVSEAIAEVESDKPEGSVVEEIEAGYRIYDKILRPARVKISKNKK